MKKSNQKTAKQPPPTNDQQKTLFQCWKTSSSSNTTALSTSSSYFVKPPDPPKQVPSETVFTEEDNEEDLELIQASDTFLNNYTVNQSTINETIYTSKTNATTIDDDNTDDRVAIGIDDQVIQATQFTDTTGFDFNSGSVWIYPIKDGQPIRSYQYNIVEQCLHKNTMVVLPTGMGKTFIAAVVMYNFYRWYPLGKIIFMAPTKPLVNQQTDACYSIVGIPKSDMTSMTGQMAPEKRKLLWDTKRVFFLTPQVISNDILRGTIDASMIKCVVIDEAHKALGEYAFCKVIDAVNEVNKNFRIIALTATPGGDNKAVQNVISKLLISHIELRSDESLDIQQYSNNREVNKFVLPLNEEIVKIRNAFYTVMRSPLKRLEINRILSIKDPGSLSKMTILSKREEFRKNVAPGMDSRKAGMIESDLALLVTLVHALELLILYGVKSFYIFLKSYVENTDGSKSGAQQHKLKNEIGNSPEMADYYEKFKEVFDAKTKPVPRTLRHPKLLKLEEVIIEHFKKFGKNETRVMIFSQYRESVYEITEMLAEHPDIKPMEFVGQSSSGGNRKTVTQKEQLEVVKQFRDGGYNTLVSTCVGEEGLDIGEVDLIINYDSQKSPIRLIQRMGRTGRKREGRIVVLLAEGKEEMSYKTSLSKKKNIYKVILNGQKHFQFYQNNPLMIPKGLRPRCHKMEIQIPPEDEETEEVEKKPKKNSKKKIENPDETTEAPKKKTRTKKKKKDEEEDSFSSQRFPDLNLDLDQTSNNNQTNLSINKTPKPVVTQLKLFNDSNTLNIKSTKLDSDILNKQKLVPDPPSFKKIFKCLTKKGKENESLFSTPVDLNECIEHWQTDEDEFMAIKDTSLNVSNNLDESSLIEKFENFYINLIDGISDDESSEDENLPELTFPNPQEDHNQVHAMIIDDTLSLSHKETDVKPPIKETTLNDLFMDEDEDDDDLKYLNDVNLDLKVNKFCIDETIHEEPQVKPANKFLNQVKDEFKENQSPVQVQNSSTPRSILKKRTHITYSPLSYSPMIDDKTAPNKRLELSMNCSNQSHSVIGMTQALDLLNSTGKVNDVKEEIVDLFDMKSTLSFLFGQDLTPNVIYGVRDSTIQILDATNLNSTGKRTRRLRFDEQSIIETSGHKKSFRNETNDDESIIVKKKGNRVIKDLSSSFSDVNTTRNNRTINSDDSEFDEIIGNNKDPSQSESQIIIDDDDDEDDDDEFEKDFVRLNKKPFKKSNKNKFILDEAEISGDDSDDDEDEDEYDLKDSFVVQNEISCDESMYLNYQKILRDTENNRQNFRPLRPITDDIFSQMPTQDASYDYDSFCIPDDQVSLYEKKSKKKSKKNKVKQDRFKRIKNLNITCADDEIGNDSHHMNNQDDKFQMTQLPRKKKLIHDHNESDDDVIPVCIETRPKQKSSYDQSLMIIDEEDDFKKFKQSPKVDKNPVKNELVLIDDDEDDDFNAFISSTKREPIKTKNEPVIIDSKETNLKRNQTKYEPVCLDDDDDDFNAFISSTKRPQTAAKNEPLQEKRNQTKFDPIDLDDDDDDFNAFISSTKKQTKSELVVKEKLKSSPKVREVKNLLKNEPVLPDDDDDFNAFISSTKKEAKNEPVVKEKLKSSPKVREVKNQPVLLDDDDDDDFNAFISSTRKEAKNEPVVIEDEKMVFKKPVKEPVNKIEKVEMVDEDDEFNNWINDTFTSSTVEPKSEVSENSSKYFFEAKIENSHFNQKKQSPPKMKTEPVKPSTKNDKSKLNTTAEVNTTLLDIPKSSNWIIVDASLLTSAADIIKYVRRIWQTDKVLIQPALHCDFIISQRYAVLRFKWTELSSASMRDQIIDRYAKSRVLYNNVVVIIVDDRDNNKNRSKLFDSVIANLSKCSPILFSKAKTEDFSYQLYYLSNNEKQFGHNIELDCNRLLDKKKKDIAFYQSLPNVSLINSLYLSQNYENIAKFCNSSLEDLKTKGKMNDRKARKLLKFIIDS